MAAGEACRALEEEGYELGSRDNLKRARAQAGVASTKQGYDSGWLWTIRTLVTGSVPSDPSSAISSKGPNSPKRPTKRPKGPISVTREEPDSSTPHPSSDDRAATFWGRGQLPPSWKGVWQSEKIPWRKDEMTVQTPLPSLSVEEVPIDLLRQDPANPRRIGEDELDSPHKKPAAVRLRPTRRRPHRRSDRHRRSPAPRRRPATWTPYRASDLARSILWEQARLLGLALNRISGTWD